MIAPLPRRTPRSSRQPRLAPNGSAALDQPMILTDSDSVIVRNPSPGLRRDSTLFPVDVSPWRDRGGLPLAQSLPQMQPVPERNRCAPRALWRAGHMLAAQAISRSSSVNVRPRADSYESMNVRELAKNTFANRPSASSSVRPSSASPRSSTTWRPTQTSRSSCSTAPRRWAAIACARRRRRGRTCVKTTAPSNGLSTSALPPAAGRSPRGQR